jgi:menaquinone-dependent protoporphyrinogen oxidase
MDMRVLVAYATRFGATAEIAEKIGQTLNQVGLQTDVLPVKDVRDLTPYQAIVLGSAVYSFKWRKEAVRFLRTNEKQLADRKVWLFSSGPTAEGDPLELTKGWRFPEAQQSIADRIQPRDIAVFGGVLDIEKLSSIEKWMMSKFDAPEGDFRDWDAITAWAEAIAKTLKEAETT